MAGGKHKAEEPTKLRPFGVPPLPYEYDQLEPYIDAETMSIHHGKLHVRYAQTLDDALEKHKDHYEEELVPLLQKVGTGDLPEDLDDVVRKFGGGHWNHTMYFMGLSPPGSSNGPHKALKQEIDRGFGSLDQFKEQFSQAALGLFGAGWAWLGMDASGDMIITTTERQDNPLMKEIVETPCVPIFGCDVWEHAYFLKYREKRQEYLAAQWNIVNWEMLYENMQAVKEGMEQARKDKKDPIAEGAKLLKATMEAGQQGSKARAEEGNSKKKAKK